MQTLELFIIQLDHTLESINDATATATELIISAC